jgi:hypothetical protein
MRPAHRAPLGARGGAGVPVAKSLARRGGATPAARLSFVSRIVTI